MEEPAGCKAANFLTIRSGNYFDKFSFRSNEHGVNTEAQPGGALKSSELAQGDPCFGAFDERCMTIA
jgi:hypothetical protein